MDYGIGTHPQSERTMSARCLAPECRWLLAATADLKAGDEACMTHTAHTKDHDKFERVWCEVSEVRPV
ncbi:hypothetical protein [Streptomyces sp. CC53]|uniref:hypothetical protein n=1 Tax=Streptomyces sp. CC53 TaxID=1906740 RepID=UPI00115FD52F|nr:hypothetical protein [Streptomyces sp. CC53]